MKKILLIPILFVFLFGCAGVKQKPVDYTGVFEQSAAATKMWGRTALTGGSKSLDNITGMVTGDLCIVIDSSKYLWFYYYDSTNTDSTGTDIAVIDPIEPLSGSGAWELVYRPNSGGKISNTTDHTITTTELYQNKTFDNQGASGEVTYTFPTFDREIERLVVTEENQAIEIKPPTGETLYLDGSELTVNYCVNADTAVGSMLGIKRAQDGSGTWHYYIINAVGNATDAGATCS